VGFRLRKSVKILPGLRLNFGLGGVSATMGMRGASVNVGKRGSFLTVGLPGSGVSYRTRIADNTPSQPNTEEQSDSTSSLQTQPNRIGGWVFLVLTVLVAATLIISNADKSANSSNELRAANSNLPSAPPAPAASQFVAQPEPPQFKIMPPRALLRSEIREVQNQLKLAHIYSAEVDGIAGANTIKAIETFLQHGNYPQAYARDTRVLELVRTHLESKN